MPSRSANSRSDRARPAASSSNHPRPRAIALISVGSHLDLSFCNATAGSTSLISTPRRLKATGAVSSMGLSLGFSDEGGTTAPPDRDCILLDHDLLDEVSNDLGSFRWGAIKRRRKTGRAIEQFPSFVARYAGCIKALEQHCRPGQCVGQDLDHSIFDLLGCQSPTLRAIRSGLGGDIIAIAPAFLDGVRWGEPLA